MCYHLCSVGFTDTHVLVGKREVDNTTRKQGRVGLVINSDRRLKF